VYKNKVLRGIFGSLKKKVIEGTALWGVSHVNPSPNQRLKTGTKKKKVRATKCIQNVVRRTGMD
jgi:hypothetical protein